MASQPENAETGSARIVDLPKKSYVRTQENCIPAGGHTNTCNGGLAVGRLGSMNWQVNDLFQQSGIFTPSESKHDAKNEARTAGADDWHKMGKELMIHSYATAQQYKDSWHQAANWIKAEHKIRDITKIEGFHAANWLRHKIDVDGIGKATAQQYAAALEKFGLALTKFTGKVHDFSKELQEVRIHAKNVLTNSHINRGYKNPENVISAISLPEHKLVAKIQLESGARIHEVGQLRSEKLTETGVLVSGKGGFKRELPLTSETLSELKKHVAENGGKMRFDYDSYLHGLKKGCEIAGETYSGSHSFRYCYARQVFDQYLKLGIGYLESLKLLSKNLGHHRYSISKRYL